MRKFVCACVTIMAFATASYAKDVSERLVDLQFAMKTHIEQSLIEGKYIRVNFETGETISLYPVNAHPMVFSLRENYVLCSKFTDDAGAAYLADFYLKPTDGGYEVFQVEIDNREPLKNLIKSGLATRIKK